MQTAGGCGRQSQQLATAMAEGPCPLQVRVSKQGDGQAPPSTASARSFHWYNPRQEGSFFKDSFESPWMVSSLEAPTLPTSKAAPLAQGDPRAVPAAGSPSDAALRGHDCSGAPPLSLPVELYLIEGKKMETRHKQASNISISQVNHLRWPQRAAARRGERREQPLKLGVIRQMKGHFEIICSQVNKRLANLGLGLKF